MAKPTLNPPKIRFVADLSLEKDLNFRLARRGEGVDGEPARARDLATTSTTTTASSLLMLSSEAITILILDGLLRASAAIGG